MQILNLNFLLLLLSIGYSSSEQFRYDNYHLVRLQPKNNKQIELIASWEQNTDFDFWTNIKGVDSHADVLLSPNAFEMYQPLFIENNIPYEIVQSNIQNKIDEQQRSMIRTKSDTRIVGKFARYSEIMQFIDQVVAANPDIASSKIAGKTLGLRDLKVLTLRSSTSGRRVWIDCGIHAREWLAPSTCIWIIDTLIKEYRSGDSVANDLLKYYEFQILPLVNPDGYEYAHTTQRLWRKNRKINAGSTCVGVDLNRNNHHGWMHSGASLNPCSDTHAGPTPDSEPETRAVQNVINAHPGEWDAFLTIHTYGNWWLTSWGYNRSLPSDYNDLIREGQNGANALRSVHGTVFTVGSSANLLYDNSGSSQDWAKGVANIKYSYTLELRPGDNTPDASYGFTIPENRAPLAGAETYVGIKELLRSISKPKTLM